MHAAWILVILGAIAVEHGRDPAAPEQADELSTNPILVLDAQGHTDAVRECRFTPDGKRLLTVSEDKTIRVWDVATGEAISVLRLPISHGYGGSLYAMDLSLDGQTLAVGGWSPLASGEGLVYLVEPATGGIRQVFRGPFGGIYHCSMKFSPDGSKLAFGGETGIVRIIDLNTGAIVKELVGDPQPIYGVAWSPDGEWLATTATQGSQARIWSVQSGETLRTLGTSRLVIERLCWSPDGRYLAIGDDWTQTLRLWNPKDGTLIREITGLNNAVISLAVTKDSTTILTTGGGRCDPRDRVVCALYDLETGSRKTSFHRHHSTVCASAISPDGEQVATGDIDGRLYLWNAKDPDRYLDLSGQGRAIYSLGWSANGQRLSFNNESFHWEIAPEQMTRSFDLGKLELLPAETTDLQMPLHQFGAFSAQLMPDGRLAVEKNGEAVSQFLMEDPGEFIFRYSFVNDRMLLVGTRFGLYAGAIATGKTVARYETPAGLVECVTTSPNRQLVACAVGQVIYLFSPANPTPLLCLFVAGNEWIAWNPNGMYASSPGGERLVGWQINHAYDETPRFLHADRFRESLYRPDVVRRLTDARSLSAALRDADAESGKATTARDVTSVLPPIVVLVEPHGDSLQTSAAQTEIRAVAAASAEHPVTSMTLLLNGRPYPETRSIARPREPEARVERHWTIELPPGKHTLSVKAATDVSSATSRAVTIERTTPAAAELPSLYVLAIGISRYEHGNDLDFAGTDAQSIARVFATHSAKLYRQVNTKVLVDATQREIIQGLGWLRRQMTQQDVGVIFFAGHGERDSDGLFYLMPGDVVPDDLFATAVSEDQLKHAIRLLPGRVIFALDACHAGSVGESPSLARRSAGSLTDDLVRDLLTDDYGVVVMCSSMGSEYSVESKRWGHGAFTKALTEGLAGIADFNGDGFVYLTEIDAYVADRVKELTGGLQHPVTQKPTSLRNFPLAQVGAPIAKEGALSPIADRGQQP